MFFRMGAWKPTSAPTRDHSMDRALGSGPPARGVGERPGTVLVSAAHGPRMQDPQGAAAIRRSQPLFPVTPGPAL
jgi:hypothetical protein